jgi:hypothetical protein
MKNWSWKRKKLGINKVYQLNIMNVMLKAVTVEELGGRAVSALSVRSRKLGIVRRGQSLEG